MIKYTIEYPMRSSVKILYNAVATPSGLSEWFAENVRLNNKNYVFTWEGYDEEASIVSKKANSHIKFSWIDEEDKPYFEFKIQVDDITNDVSLIVTDYAEDEEDKSDATRLWDKQIQKLKSSIGS
ncbi:MAG: START-like domain-containing protein [Flavobacteriales bacterium]|jgi:uncharacterized protein YndB with AHSA1/START domain|nr:START-like domain-containing protein [Flavobacteriales bacterium]